MGSGDGEHGPTVFSGWGDECKPAEDVRPIFSTQVMEQLLADQQLLSKQIDATGQAVAKLTLNRASHSGGRPPSPVSSEDLPNHRT